MSTETNTATRPYWTLSDDELMEKATPDEIAKANKLADRAGHRSTPPYGDNRGEVHQRTDYAYKTALKKLVQERLKREFDNRPMSQAEVDKWRKDQVDRARRMADQVMDEVEAKEKAKLAKDSQNTASPTPESQSTPASGQQPEHPGEKTNQPRPWLKAIKNIFGGRF